MHRTIHFHSSLFCVTIILNCQIKFSPNFIFFFAGFWFSACLIYDLFLLFINVPFCQWPLSGAGFGINLWNKLLFFFSFLTFFFSFRRILSLIELMWDAICHWYKKLGLVSCFLKLYFSLCTLALFCRDLTLNQGCKYHGLFI